MNKLKNNKSKRLRRSFIPNIATVFNMFLGFLAISYIMNDEPTIAGWIMILGIFFDVIDGKLARLMGLTSKFGTEFDSLADTITFCAVPSLLVYHTYVDGLPKLLGAAISFMPLLFGTIRLAKYNIASVDGPKPYFVGLPTPMGALTIVSFMLFNLDLYDNMGDPRSALVLVALVSILEISPVRITKFPYLSIKKGRSNNLRLFGLVLVLVGLLFFQGLILFPIVSIYISWSIIQWMIDHDRLSEDNDVNIQVGNFHE